MSNPFKQSFQALKTSLEAITVANGYSLTVAEVDYIASITQDIPEGQLPFIGIVPIGTSYQDLPTEGAASKRVALVCHQNIDDDDATQAMEAICDIELDVYDALYDDRNLDGDADMYVKIQASQDTIGDHQSQVARVATTVIQIEMKIFVPPKAQR